MVLRNPDIRLWLIEHHRFCNFRPEESTPLQVFLGREVTTSSGRDLVGLGDLKRRAYLGPTSLDNEIALLMANMAQVRILPITPRQSTSYPV